MNSRFPELPGCFGYAVKQDSPTSWRWMAWKGDDTVDGRRRLIAPQRGTASSLEECERDIQAQFGDFNGKAWRNGNNTIDRYWDAPIVQVDINAKPTPKPAQASFGF